MSHTFIYHKNAFTLVELLVVISIIAVLAGLLLPALAKGKSAALTTECRNNLRTIGLAQRMYVDDYNAFPPVTAGGVMGASREYGWLMLDSWKEQLIPTLGLAIQFADRGGATMRILRCPQLVSNNEGIRGNGQYACNASGTAPFQNRANLGVGGFFDGRVVPTAESVVRVPSNLIVAGDVSPGFSLPDGKFWTSGHFDICATNSAKWPGAHHNGRANVVFADGHVENGKRSAWISTNYSARARWNNDNEPHPETWAR